MKLKRIVRDVLKERRINEISLHKGDASKHTSQDLLNEYIGRDDKFFSLVSKKYGKGTPSKWSSFYWLDQKGVRDSPLDATLQSYIKKNDENLYNKIINSKTTYLGTFLKLIKY